LGAFKAKQCDESAVRIANQTTKVTWSQ